MSDETHDPSLSSDNIIQAIREDFDKLARLSVEQRRSLIANLGDFLPSSSTIENDEIAEIAQASDVDNATVSASLRIARIFSDPEPSVRVRKIASALGSTPTNNTILDEFITVGKKIERKMEHVVAIARTMPSFGSCNIACDLRHVTGGAQGQFDLAPVAIVRLTFDEDNAQAIFQCTPQALSRLAKAFQEASATLSLLDEIVRERLNVRSIT